MSFETEITGNDNADYHLDIETLYKSVESDKPDVIYIFIRISKLIGEEKFPADSLDLKYTLLTREYDALEELEGINEMLYNQIIEYLDETYGFLWGFFDQGL